jgi:hypothetical protein
MGWLVAGLPPRHKGAKEFQGFSSLCLGVLVVKKENQGRKRSLLLASL